MPTTDYSHNGVEAEYEKLEGVISNIPQKDLLIVTGDFNAKIGNTKNDDHIRNIVGNGNGAYGLVKKNHQDLSSSAQIII